MRKWRADEERTDVKVGPFSKAENDALLAATNTFAVAHGLSVDGDYEWLRNLKTVGVTGDLRGGLMRDIANVLPNRKFTSVLSHLRRVTHPGNGKGPWSTEEDSQLRDLFAVSSDSPFF